jgi:hypothetical protein
MTDQYYVDMEGKTAGPFTGAELFKLYDAGRINSGTLFTKHNAQEWLPLETILPLLQPEFRHIPPPHLKPIVEAPTKPIADRRDSICMTCGMIGKPVLHTKGSFAIELALWLLFCAPGLIYSIWRLTSKASVCRVCQSTNIIPASSPQGQKIADVR